MMKSQDAAASLQRAGHGAAEAFKPSTAVWHEELNVAMP
jgi:hypothetical protein